MVSVLRLADWWFRRGHVAQPVLFVILSMAFWYGVSRIVLGWINYLAVDPAHRKKGHARALMREAERLLEAAGCPKINLQIRSSNASVIAFYRAIGYVQDDVVSVGRRLIADE